MTFTNLLSTLLYVLVVLSSSYTTSDQILNPPEAEAEAEAAVLDIEGHQLQDATKYYILPVQSNGNGGGLALSSRDGTCPFYVIQENNEHSNGLPLRFLANNNKQGANISLSADVNIVFHAATICVQSTGWKLGGVDEVTGRRYVKSGGLTGRPGMNTVSNWFKVEKYDNGYKIVYCPSVCTSCKFACGDVGVFSEDGKRWLGVSDEPLVVMFKKA